MMDSAEDATLYLQDGSVWRGKIAGAKKNVSGEVGKKKLQMSFRFRNIQIFDSGCAKHETSLVWIKVI